MPHAIPEGETVRGDHKRLAALTLEALPAPDMGAASLIPWDTREQAEGLALAVMRGEAQALGVRRAGALVGQVFFRTSGDTFRLIAAHSMPGMEAGEPWAVVLPMIETHAAALGCRRLVCDTSRPGVLRSLLASGYAVSETILTKTL